MIIVDVNLLLHTVITGFPQHPNARAWWERSINEGTSIGLTGPTIFGFLRIATNPRVLESPLPVDTAISYVTGWLEQPSVEFIVPGPRHLEVAFGLLKGSGPLATSPQPCNSPPTPSNGRRRSAPTTWTSAASPACAGKTRWPADEWFLPRPPVQPRAAPALQPG